MALNRDNPGVLCPLDECKAPVCDTGGGTYVCSQACGWWVMHEDWWGDEITLRCEDIIEDW